MPQRILREQLIEGGSRALYENGFHATSVSDIAAAAGVPKGSVYNHFESKEALALEALRRYAASYDLEPLRSGSAPPMQRLRAFLSGVIDTTVARGVELGCLLGNFSDSSAGRLLRQSAAVRYSASSANQHARSQGWNESLTQVDLSV
jgi:TetR/AcrR family transcriptional repressor of nem operon